NYDEMFWQARNQSATNEFSHLTTQTVPNNFDIEQFVVTTGMKHNHVSDSARHEPLTVEQTFNFHLTTNESITLEKQVIVLTSRDVPEENQIAQLEQSFTDFGQDYHSLKEEHVLAWKKRWQLADVLIE